ncbi:MAG: aryl-sulfate sulfotransferase [Bacteroidales bacterium]|nr:aryl-sulfate sulfotransferase [Bacteroidales bacterium]
MKYFLSSGIWLIVILILGFNKCVHSQNQIPDDFEYLSPLPSSKFISSQHNITFRFNKPDHQFELNEVKVLIKGSLSGNNTGNLILADDHITFIFKSVKPFVSNETIEVEIISSEYISNINFKYYFLTSSLSNYNRHQIAKKAINQRFNKLTNPPKNSPIKNSNLFNQNSLPEGFPEISITYQNNPSPGYIFIAPYSYETSSLFNIILDNNGTPVYYKKTGNGSADFKVQPSGDITYYDIQSGKYYRMNSLYEIVDTISVSNGYYSDMHELRMLENGHSLLMGIDPQLVNMDTVVPGGYPQAVVVGLVVQELDASKEVVFQWRSWDHFQITDASDYVNLNDSLIDYVHGNSIEIVSDTNLLLSCRNMNEITNINRSTGEIIWRLGGKNNMFDMINLTDTFCMQHSIRLMPDSINLSLFDNGNCHSPEPYSSAIEYHVNETTMTVEMVNQIRNEPDIFGEFMGHAQRLQNGNTIIGWGYGVPSVSEYNSEGDKLLEISFPYANYRAFKFDWETTVFEIDMEEINFGNILLQDSALQTIEISNNCNYPIEINRFLSNSNAFFPEENLPIIIPENGDETITIKFKADSVGSFNDMLTLCWDIETDTLVQRIARQVALSGNIIENQGFSDNQDKPSLYVFPNPFKEQITVHSADHLIEHFKIYNHTGILVVEKENIFSNKCLIQFDNPTGTYFLEVTLKNGHRFTTKILKL